ncbi:MAG TPA: 23S rRNA (adenine(2503)-C(2))-methyltransferase RlmN [Tepidisphaeraceae bacterium]|jgi:23S rRNA (adenine2503-C2)-methyltransferase|nr:23S rRNA (adenine(2503)-C(2))-methyltransferase RlmN [Tepidisphaeraceae bacterium]
MMQSLSDHDVDSLASLFSAWGFKPIQAAKLLRAFYEGDGEVDWQELRLGKQLQARVEAELPLRSSRLLTTRTSVDGTSKFLLSFDRGGAVECVLMPAYDPTRAAGCVSSQIGCAMGCDFCASTKSGLERNLEAGEIVEQFLTLRRHASAGGRRLSTLVFMGMGEPMHNLENVIAAVRRIASPTMGNLGFRNITISTVGIIPGIERLAEADLNVHLALSLHAPDDQTRSRIVPTGRKFGVVEIVAAARRFQEQTGRIVTIEYCLLEGINDSDQQAQSLAELLHDFRAHVNLIPYNPIGPGLSGAIYRTPSPAKISAFGAILRARGVVAHIRRTRGDDVSAACGQLREMMA